MRGSDGTQAYSPLPIGRGEQGFRNREHRAYQVGASDSDQRFDVILECRFTPCPCRAKHLPTSTHVEPPFPCSGDSTHLKLREVGDVKWLISVEWGQQCLTTYKYWRNSQSVSIGYGSLGDIV